MFSDCYKINILRYLSTYWHERPFPLPSACPAVALAKAEEEWCQAEVRLRVRFSLKDSRNERLKDCLNRRNSDRTIWAGRGNRFSLSRGERAGVRASFTLTLSGFARRGAARLKPRFHKTTIVIFSKWSGSAIDGLFAAPVVSPHHGLSNVWVLREIGGGRARAFCRIETRLRE